VMLRIVVEVTGTVCGAGCSIFSQTVDRLPQSSSSSTNFIATQVLNKTSGPLCVMYYTTAVMSTASINTIRLHRKRATKDSCYWS